MSFFVHVFVHLLFYRLLIRFSKEDISIVEVAVSRCRTWNKSVIEVRVYNVQIFDFPFRTIYTFLQNCNFYQSSLKKLSLFSLYFNNINCKFLT